MGNVSRLADRLRPVAPVLASEDDVLGVAGQLVRTEDPEILPALRLSGLLGASVPSAEGGADVSNAVLAEMVALVAERNSEAGRAIASHVRVVELLRSRAGAGQRRYFMGRALAGDRFAEIDGRSGLVLSRLSPHHGSGLEGMLAGTLAITLEVTLAFTLTSAEQSADWLVLSAESDDGTPCRVILPARMPGLRLDAGRLSGDAVVLGADHVLPDAAPGPVTVAISDLVAAAIVLGETRRQIRAIRSALEARRGDQAQSVFLGLLGRYGALVTEAAAAAALIEHNGMRIDMAQVNDERPAGREVSRLGAMARVMAESIRRNAGLLADDLARLDGADGRSQRRGIFSLPALAERHLLEDIGRSALD